MEVQILGARGSVPVSGMDFEEFGGATTCIRILAGGQEIYLDAGTGIAGVVPEKDTQISVLFSHAHLDHLVGLPFFGGLLKSDRHIQMFMKERGGQGVEDILGHLFVPPYWPLMIQEFPALVSFHALPERLVLDKVTVESMEGSHPGGATVYKILHDDASVVIATDYEHSTEADGRLAAFAAGAGLLVYDGQYTEKEYLKYKGYGHSTPEQGVRIAREAGVERLVITHHLPERRDEELAELERKIQRSVQPDSLEVSFARQGKIVHIRKGMVLK